MLDLTDDERQSLHLVHALSTDPQGQETLIGLTPTESTRMRQLIGQFANISTDDISEYMTLMERHHTAHMDSLFDSYLKSD